jgi:serine O-acetyltransferase
MEGGRMSTTDTPPPKPVIPSFAAFRAMLREDYAANTRMFWAPGFQALAIYRLGVWCDSIRSRFIRFPVRLLHRLLYVLVRNFYGIELPVRTRVGRRLRIVHQHGIVIHPHAVIGDDCILRQGVSIGALRAGAGTEPPVLGDRVEVGAGAILIGPIRIGNDAVIGPNAVVMTDVPAGAMVVAPRARIMAPPPRRVADESAADAGDTPADPPRRALP